MTQPSPDQDRVFDQVFCARTRAARIARGLSQAEVARALGISRAAYARYEADQPLPLHLVEEVLHERILRFRIPGRQFFAKEA